MLGQYQRATESDPDQPPYVSLISYLALGQFAEAAALVRLRHAPTSARIHTWMLMMQLFDAILAGRQADGRQALEELTSYTGLQRSGRLVLLGAGRCACSATCRTRWNWCGRPCTTGFACPRALESTPLLDPLRGQAEFAALLGQAREGHEAAVEAFTKADGHRLLGLPRA